MGAEWNDTGFLEAIARLEAGIEKAAGTALEAYAGTVLGKAIEVTPKDTGRLRLSARTSKPTTNGNRVEVAISFNTPYAEKQEETDWYRHRIGKAHYLRDTVQAADDPAEALAKPLKATIEQLWRA